MPAVLEADHFPLAPFEEVLFTVLGVGCIDSTKFDRDIRGGDGRANPTARSIGGENVGGGRKIDLVQTVVILPVQPGVAVTVNVGLGRSSRAYLREECLAIDESADFHLPVSRNDILTIHLGIVMADDNARFIGKRVDDPAKPGELLLAEFTLDLVHVSKRIEEDPVHQRRFDEAAMFSRDGRGEMFLIERRLERAPVIVVSKGEMNRKPCLPERINQLEEGGVIAGLSVEKGAIPVDDDSRQGFLFRDHFGHDLFQVIGHVDALF